MQSNMCVCVCPKEIRGETRTHVAHCQGSPGTFSIPSFTSWTRPGDAPVARASRSVLFSSRPASLGHVQARGAVCNIPPLKAPTFLRSQDESKDSGGNNEGGTQTGSREDEQEAVKRSVRDALLQRGAKPSSSPDQGKQSSSKEGKPFQFQARRRGGGPPGMGGGGPPIRPSPAKILAGHGEQS
eukprot:scaffold11752_cov20-Tisochrysis_lutea.AAC.1